MGCQCGRRAGRSPRLCAPALVAVLVLAAAQAAWPAPATIVGRITDEHGRALPARVVVAREDWQKAQVAFTDAKGRYRMAFESGPCRVQASHGPEYGIDERIVDLARGTNKLDLELRCLLDMSRRGWYGGDVHVHSKVSDGAQSPESIARAAQCEGLAWAALTDSNSVAGAAEWLAEGTRRFIPLLGQEVATSRGHILAVGISQRVDEDTGQGAKDVCRICTQIGAQGGFAVLAHPTVPGMAYRDWDVAAYDGIEVLNGLLPPYSGVFDDLQGRRRWHDLLSKGRFPVACGGSDSRDIGNALLRGLLTDPAGAVKKEPRLGLLRRALDPALGLPFLRKGNFVGAVRTYVHCRELTAAGVIDGLKGGATFVTNGPLLLATVDGRLPGQTVQVEGRRTVSVTVEAVSNVGLERIDVVADGGLLKRLPANDPKRVDETLQVPVSGRKWLVLECYGPWPELAITNAWRLEA